MSVFLGRWRHFCPGTSDRLSLAKLSFWPKRGQVDIFWQGQKRALEKSLDALSVFLCLLGFCINRSVQLQHSPAWGFAPEPQRFSHVMGLRPQTSWSHRESGTWLRFGRNPACPRIGVVRDVFFFSPNSALLPCFSGRFANEIQGMIVCLSFFFFFFFNIFLSSYCGAVEMNPTRNDEVAGSVPGLAQWVRDPALL